MAFNKQLVLVALALAAVVVSSTPYYGYSGGFERAAPNKSHNLIMGSRVPGDRLVYQENIVKPSKWLQIVEVTKAFNVTNYQVITQVRALDQKTNGNGAFASRVAGGPGYPNISLKFKSQRGHGINFVVQIYAKSRY